jgi:uncharacterized membrane protein
VLNYFSAVAVGNLNAVGFADSMGVFAANALSEVVVGQHVIFAWVGAILI